MIDITEYIRQSQAERQRHLCLEEPCVERGCNSQACRGLLAHVLDTTVPKGLKVVLCHACHNGKCNNPKHMYWGTASENLKDTIANNGLTLHQRMLVKYGPEKTHEIMVASGKQRGKGSNNHAG